MRRLLLLSFTLFLISVSYIAYQATHPETLTIETDAITFTSSHRHIMPGQCPTVTWDVRDAETILINDIPVSAQGSIIDCVDPLKLPTLTVDGQVIRLPIDILYTRIDILLAVGIGLFSLLMLVFATIHRQQVMTIDTVEKTLFIYIGVCFGLWSALFIMNSSVVASDGNRYYALFDDALITMRYANNLIEGNGAVYNIGEQVEGYSNPLWLLVMSGLLLITDQVTAVLWVQILGSLLMVTSAIIATCIITIWLKDYSPTIQSAMRVLTFIVMLWGNYAYAYYSLMGMEISLQVLLLMMALLYSIRYGESESIRNLLIISSCIGLSYLTNPDTIWLLIPFGIFLALIQPLYIRKALRNTLLLMSIACLIWAMHIGIRYFYYGDLISNIAVYQSGIPLQDRLMIGANYLRTSIQPFLPMIALVIMGMILNRHRFKIGILLIVLTQLIGQGILLSDFPPLAQYLHFSVLCLILLLIVDIATLLQLMTQRINTSPKRLAIGQAFLTLIALASIIVVNNWDYKRQLALLIRPFYVFEYEEFINEAVALNTILTEEGSVGVLWAGTVPYYTNAQAYDFLGRTDPIVAQSSANYNEGYFLSGVNKTNFLHSISEQQPDYIETCRILNDDVCHLVGEVYAYYTYENHLRLLLRIESPHIRWQHLTE